MDIFLRLKDGKFEVRRTLARGQWGASQDDAGRVFRNSNESALHVDLVPTLYFARIPALTRTRGSYEFLGGARRRSQRGLAGAADAGVNRGYQAGILRPDGSLARFTAVCAPTVYRGDRLPAELYGNVFVAEPAGNLVSRIVVTDDGATLRGRKAYDRGEFVASHRRAVSSRQSCRRRRTARCTSSTCIAASSSTADTSPSTCAIRSCRARSNSRSGCGRIWRVVHDNARRGSNPSFARAPRRATLVDALSHPNGWWRDTAQQLLVQRNDKAAIEPLKTLADAAPAPRTRCTRCGPSTAWTVSTPASVTRALGDPSRDVRVSAIRLVGTLAARRERRDAERPSSRSSSDTDWAVRGQLAASLGELPHGAKEIAMAAFLERHALDPVAMDAALSGLSGSEAAVLEALYARDGTRRRSARPPSRCSPRRSFPAREDAAMQRLFDAIAEPARPAWQRSALLRGAEVTLLGGDALRAASRAVAAGRGPAPAADAPCPTCPGGRAGPGGAAAFPRRGAPRSEAVGEGDTPRSGRRNGTRTGVDAVAARPAVQLTREPALTTLAAANAGDLSSRADGRARATRSGPASRAAQRPPRR